MACLTVHALFDLTANDLMSTAILIFFTPGDTVIELIQILERGTFVQAGYTAVLKEKR